MARISCTKRRILLLVAMEAALVCVYLCTTGKFGDPRKIKMAGKEFLHWTAGGMAKENGKYNNAVVPNRTVVLDNFFKSIVRIKSNVGLSSEDFTLAASIAENFKVNATSSDGHDYIIDNPGCKIRKVDPLHPSVKYLFHHLPDLNCEGLSFVTVENTTLWLNAPENVTCFVQSIYRKNDTHSKLGNAVRMKNGALRISSEFVTVKCKAIPKNITIYRQFYPFVFPKKSVEKRIQSYNEQQRLLRKEKFQIIMVGLDSSSKNQFLRHMFKTFDFIKRKLIYAEFHGFNKIGKNTFTNILPMLTGKLEDEVPNMSETLADVLPIIWRDFMRSGYRTQYSTDFSWGSVFNYGRKGFADPPVDYYLRPWSLSVEPYISQWKTGCINERIEASVLFKYIEDFFDTFPKVPLFTFTFLARMSHDYINRLRYHDKVVRNFLERMHLKGHLNNTFVFFFGDHGFRYGKIRYTYVGRTEGRLPFMFVMVPPSFPSKYPQMFKNLKTNERRLATSLDIYATLKHLLHFDGEGFDTEISGRSVSLLRHPLRANRTCKDAFIKNQWCACAKSEPISIEDERIKSSASEIVKKINIITKEYRSRCATLYLHSILSASKQDLGTGEEAERDGFSNFLVTVQVSPGRGIFEGSVWFNGQMSYSVDNSIERINLYRNQSACVYQNVLKPYCFCKV